MKYSTAVGTASRHRSRGVPLKNFHTQRTPPLCHPNRAMWAAGLCNSCYKAKWKRENPEKHALSYQSYKDSGGVKFSRLLRKYGITRTDYESMLDSQGGGCAICGSRPDLLCVDHDHLTGKVRGLLCSTCNKGLGHFCDDPGLLGRATNYLLYGCDFYGLLQHGRDEAANKEPAVRAQ